MKARKEIIKKASKFLIKKCPQCGFGTWEDLIYCLKCESILEFDKADTKGYIDTGQVLFLACLGVIVVISLAVSIIF